MLERGNARLCWLVLLVFAQGVQAFTPDATSLASSRLIRMIGGASSKSGLLTIPPTARQAERWLAEQMPAPWSSPEEGDRDDEDSEQVCLTACPGEVQSRGVTATPRTTRMDWTCADDRNLSTRHVACSWGVVPALAGPALVYSLCRMTC
jgi:hypothetical protein